MATKYMHTLDGKPAYFAGDQIVLGGQKRASKAIPLVNDLRTIRFQQLLTHDIKESRMTVRNNTAKHRATKGITGGGRIAREVFVDAITPIDDPDSTRWLAASVGVDAAQMKSDIDKFWFAVHNSWDIEPREYFEKEARENGFDSPLAMAVHYMWKREVKALPAIAAVSPSDAEKDLARIGISGLPKPDAQPPSEEGCDAMEIMRVE